MSVCSVSTITLNSDSHSLSQANDQRRGKKRDSSIGVPAGKETKLRRKLKTENLTAQKYHFHGDCYLII